MKLKYASAYTDNNEIDNNLSYPLDADRTIESRKFIEIVEARVEEIIENVIYQIPPEFIDKLLGGFILTGGGSNLRNIERAFPQPYTCKQDKDCAVRITHHHLRRCRHQCEERNNEHHSGLVGQGRHELRRC